MSTDTRILNLLCEISYNLARPGPAGLRLQQQLQDLHAVPARGDRKGGRTVHPCVLPDVRLGLQQPVRQLGVPPPAPPAVRGRKLYGGL